MFRADTTNYASALNAGATNAGATNAETSYPSALNAYAANPSTRPSGRRLSFPLDHLLERHSGAGQFSKRADLQSITIVMQPW